MYILAGKIETLQQETEEDLSGYTLPHPIWSKEEVESVQITHTPPVTVSDKVKDGLVRYHQIEASSK